MESSLGYPYYPNTQDSTICPFCLEEIGQGVENIRKHHAEENHPHNVHPPQFMRAMELANRKLYDSKYRELTGGNPPAICDKHRHSSELKDMIECPDCKI